MPGPSGNICQVPRRRGRGRGAVENLGFQQLPRHLAKFMHEKNMFHDSSSFKKIILKLFFFYLPGPSEEGGGGAEGLLKTLVFNSSLGTWQSLCMKKTMFHKSSSFKKIILKLFFFCNSCFQNLTTVQPPYNSHPWGNKKWLL